MKYIYEGRLTDDIDGRLILDHENLRDLLYMCYKADDMSMPFGPMRITFELLEEVGECEADEDIAAGRVESFKSLDELTDWLEADDE